MSSVSANEFRKMINEEEVLVVDVRESWEYDEENIGALNIPLAELPENLDELAPYKDQTVVVHCQTGRRSHQAKKYLTQQGFADVRSLEGGLAEYLEQFEK